MRERVLIVDDSALVRKLYRNMLSLRSFDAEEAVDGKSGLEAMVRLRPDLVLLDLGLPDVDGLDVLRRMKSDSRLKETPVVVLSGRETEGVVRAALELGASGFLSKASTRPAEVVDQIEKVIAARPTRSYRVLIDPISLDAKELATALGRELLACDDCHGVLALEVFVGGSRIGERGEFQAKLVCPDCASRKAAVS
jgi:CheY-like chemotaxis protein